jgi:hypothetical protein
VAGPDTLAVGVSGEFAAEAHDPDGDRLRVYVAWGDGDTSDFGEFVETGRVIVFVHAYGQVGEYPVRARCHDLAPRFSDWSAARPVVVR